MKIDRVETIAIIQDHFRAWIVNRMGESKVNPNNPSKSFLIQGSANERDANILAGQISRSQLTRTRPKAQSLPPSNGNGGWLKETKAILEEEQRSQE